MVLSSRSTRTGGGEGVPVAAYTSDDARRNCPKTLVFFSIASEISMP
jgi:hypothetical protein